MTTFLFWNVQRKSLDDLVCRLVKEHGVDVLVLIESQPPPSALLEKLKEIAPFHQIASHERFGVFTRFDGSRLTRMETAGGGNRLNVWRLALFPERDVIFAAVHGLDMRNKEPADRRFFLNQVAAAIELIEIKLGHKRTIVLGDFNANPFDDVMGDVQGLHAIRVPHVGTRTYRKVGGVRQEFFYNPMWACSGRAGESPPATYFFNDSRTHEQFWHMLDQVVLRSELLPLFPENELRILDEAGGVKLVTRFGLPDKQRASDHLPVLFRINFLAEGRINARKSLAGDRSQYPEYSEVRPPGSGQGGRGEDE